MAHFAKLDNSGKVTQVVVVHNNDAPNEAAGVAFLENLLGAGPWVQTSYNGSIRKNFAGVGYTYDSGRDAFIPPKAFPSWVLDEAKCIWNPPVAMPMDGQRWRWDEANVQWVTP